jgi:hypothetical protein
LREHTPAQRKISIETFLDARASKAAKDVESHCGAVNPQKAPPPAVLGDHHC